LLLINSFFKGDAHEDTSMRAINEMIVEYLLIIFLFKENRDHAAVDAI
jgi:hypothetical protein